MLCRWPTSRSARPSTTSSWCPARAARSFAPPAPPHSSWPRRATSPRSACPRARSGGRACAAWPRSARSATSTTRTRASARPVAPGTWASGREVRGVVMNPRDHPHGGGEGKSPTGMPPKTPWGKPAMGLRTRRSKSSGRHRPLAAPQELGAGTMSRSLKKGPFVEARLLGRVQEMNRRNERKVAQDVVARQRHLPRLRRPHRGRLQRQEAHPRLRDGEHGRPSTRRVLAHPQLSAGTASTPSARRR